VQLGNEGKIEAAWICRACPFLRGSVVFGITVMNQTVRFLLCGFFGALGLASARADVSKDDSQKIAAYFAQQEMQSHMGSIISSTTGAEGLYWRFALCGRGAGANREVHGGHRPPLQQKIRGLRVLRANHFPSSVPGAKRALYRLIKTPALFGMPGSDPLQST
jgi:hypothetical protein